MEQYELGTAAAWERIVALQREATQARLAKSRRPAAASPGRGGMTMLTEHQHKPGEFDHYHHVQRQEQALKQAHRWAREARRDATWALWSATIGIVLAAIALLTG
jgi:hypothetical protein